VPEILGFLSEKFGPYPFRSAGSIVVVDTGGEGSVALETQTRPTYDTLFYYASAVHELTHQWFGDSVSFSDWRDGCIAECFAQYAGLLWGEKDGIDPDGYYRSTVDEHKNDAKYWQVTIYDPGPSQPLDVALYDRGSLMLHALRRTVGDQIFFRTLQHWQAQHKYGNGSWPDFEKLAAQESGQDLTGFFHAWAHSSVIPPEKL
jgi:aminopeptidase N